MRFPRSAKILRSQFDIAPFAAVFFALLILLMLARLLPVPGLLTNLTPPAAADLAGVDTPTIAIALDNQGRLFCDNQLVTERILATTLSVAAKASPQPLTLVIHADRTASYDQLAHLVLLARNAGITNALLATLPLAKP
jgi:biopolymer transport protein ExbD